MRSGSGSINRNRFKTALYWAFGGIVAVLVTTVGLALYMTTQLGQAVENTTHEILPETLAALRLSERSALLAALAPTLASARDDGELQQLAERLDELIQDIMLSITRLGVRVAPDTVTVLRDRVLLLAHTLQTLKEANAERIVLGQRQSERLAEIRKAHSEFNDTVSPVIYGVTSLSQLLAKRGVRQQVTGLQGLQEQHLQLVLSSMALRLGLESARAAPASSDLTQVWEAASRSLREALDRLAAARHLRLQAELAQLATVAERFLKTEPSNEQFDSRRGQFEAAFDHYLEQVKLHSATHLREALEEAQTALAKLIEQMTRDLGYALDIRAEGNLLFALLATSAEANEPNTLVALQDRFKRSYEIFEGAAGTFQTSELARRNPVLADNVNSINKHLTLFGAEQNSLFTIRQQSLRVEEQIQVRLAEGRRIAKALTEQIDSLVGRVQLDTEALQQALANQQQALTWTLMWVCAGGLLLAGLIAYGSARILERHERDLHDAKEAADRANLIKSEFLANMSHEIRTPMNGVLGTLDLLKTTGMGGKQLCYLDTAQSSAKNLLRIINDILDVSKLESGRLSLEQIEFDLHHQVEETVGLLANEAQRKDLELVCLVAQQVPQRVLGDPTRLHQILTNLLSNAIKFTEQGEVVLRVELAAAGQLRFLVRDTGIGMAEAQQAQIFDAFVQADGSTTRKYGGTGLGLTISRQLVALMGGTLTVQQSALGQGSVFSFALPLEAAGTPPLVRRSLARAGQRVLVVDDNVASRQALREYLEAWDIQPTVVENGTTALEVLRSESRAGCSYQLVLLDRQMPILDGLALAHAIRADQALKNLWLVMLGAERPLEGGRVADAWLNKPVRGSELYQVLAEALGIEPAERAMVNALSDERKALALKQKRVLLVEDNLVNQLVCHEMLLQLGATVVLTNNGQEALVALAAHDFDLVLMDCQMPEMDGYEATQEIRRLEQAEQRTRLPIIALTAHAMPGDREKCLDMGMDDYLMKPFQFAEFKALLERWLAAG